MTYQGPRYDKEAWRASVTNGKIPDAKLHEVEAWPVPYDRDLRGPARMHPEAASAMGVMLRTAWAKDIGLTIGLSYRTYAKQLEKYEDFQNGGNLAATPGTSNHGWAVACDMSWRSAAGLSWLQANAAKFGFRADVPSENWHYTYQEGLWKGDDMTEEEKAQLLASAEWRDGDKVYRQKYAQAGKDPGPPPENWSPAKRDGWGSARFPVKLLAQHDK